jgi:hypothetical protein
MTKLAKSAVGIAQSSTPYAVENHNTAVPGDMVYRSNQGVSMQTPHTYREEVHQCRFFYRYDSIASTVINRMSDMSITPITESSCRI